MCGLHKWKSFYSIRHLNVNGQKSSADKVEATLYCHESAEPIFDHRYCTDQIFNANETSLSYKMLPSKILAMKADREAPILKKCKEHVTVLTCANASGSL